MTVQMIVVNAQQQARMVNLLKGDQLIIAKGDTIRLDAKANIKTLRKGNDLIIKNANGEEFILKDFYAKSENSEENQLLTWDDPLGQEKEIFSSDQSETIQVAANDTGVSSDANGNPEVIKDTSTPINDVAPATESESGNRSGAVLLGLLGGLPPIP